MNLINIQNRVTWYFSFAYDSKPNPLEVLPKNIGRILLSIGREYKTNMECKIITCLLSVWMCMYNSLNPLDIKKSSIFKISNLMSGWRTFWLMPKIYDVEKTHLAKENRTSCLITYIIQLCLLLLHTHILFCFAQFNHFRWKWARCTKNSLFQFTIY